MFTICECVHEKRISHNIDLYASALLLYGAKKRQEIWKRVEWVHTHKKTAMNDWCTRRIFPLFSQFIKSFKCCKTSEKNCIFSCCVFQLCCNHFFSEVNWWPFLRACILCVCLTRCILREFFCWQCLSYRRCLQIYRNENFLKRD